MKNTKFFNVMISALLIVVLGSYDVVSASAINFFLNNNATTATTKFNTGSSGYHTVLVNGYEHKGTEYKKYSITNSISGGGDLTVVHHTTMGYVFSPEHDNIRLSTTVCLGSKILLYALI